MTGRQGDGGGKLKTGKDRVEGDKERRGRDNVRKKSKAKQRNPRRREEGKNGNLEKGFVGVKGLSQGHKA